MVMEGMVVEATSKALEATVHAVTSVVVVASAEALEAVEASAEAVASAAAADPNLQFFLKKAWGYGFFFVFLQLIQ